MLNDLSIFIVPPLLTMIAGISLAVLSLLKGRGDRENLLFALICLGWSLLSPAFISHHLIKDPAVILTIERSIHSLYVFLPALNLLFFHKILHIKRPLVTYSGFIISALLSLTTFTNGYFNGLYKFHWGYIARGGIFFKIFSFYSFLALCYCVFYFFQRLRIETNPVLRLKSKYILFSFILAGCLTATNVPALNGYDFYPFGNFIFLPLCLMAYGVLKYHLLDIRSMLHRTAFWILTSSLILVPNILFFAFLRPHFQKISTPVLFIALVICFILNYLYIRKVQPLINKVFHQVRYNLAQVERVFVSNILTLKGLEPLIRQLGKALNDTLEFENFDLYLRSDSPGIFTDTAGNRLAMDPEIEHRLSIEPRLLQRLLVQTSPRYAAYKDKLMPYFTGGDYYYLLPLVMNGQLQAVLFLPQRSHYNSIKPEEVKFLNNITTSAAVALANSRMYQDITNLKDSLEERSIALTREIADRIRSETEKRQLEARLQYARKMEAIGTLAGGVAHDLNNILSGIINYPELLLMDLAEDDPLVKPIQTIRNSGEKAAAIVQDLLTLARRGAAAFVPVNLNAVVRTYLSGPEWENLMQHHPGVVIEEFLEPQLKYIMGSQLHLSKTLMNLVANAAESIAGRGVITIATANYLLEEEITGYHPIEKGDYVTLSISDTGSGIEANDLERVFEPFYTRKIMGRSGSGLGMAVVWGTVKDHNGYIDTYSKINEGTRFTLYFPATENKPAHDEYRRSFRAFPGKGESILVVDDVKEQRLIATEMLERLGYVVSSVACGEDAVTYMSQHSAHLILLDMIMDPGIDGLETYRRICRIHPNQNVVVTSGYSETQRVKELLETGNGAYIKKPYMMDEIARVIRSQLDQKNPLKN